MTAVILSRKRQFALAALLLVSAPSAAEAQRRIGPVSAWISDADYPAESRARGEEGVVTVRYQITATGRAADCRPLFARAPLRLYRTTCALIEQRARYVPAYDTRGRPIASEDELSVAWVLPSARVMVGFVDYGGSIPVARTSFISDLDYNAAVAALGNVSVVANISIAADGRVVACATAPSSGSPAVDRHTCELIRSRARFRQPVDERGQPRATSGRMIVHWRRP